MVALGDLDEDDMLFAGFQGVGAGAFDGVSVAPALPPLRRRLLLSRLVMAKGDETGAAFTPDQAVRLADELARLLDQVQTEGCSLASIKPEDDDRFAAHWQTIAQFLSLLSDVWPLILADEGCLDPAERRNQLLRGQAAAWRDGPPAGPVVAAGITGSVPAAAELLAVVASLPDGDVVLPGLDQQLDEESWAVLDDSHPQHALKRLLAIMQVDRDQVQDWPAQPQLGALAQAALADPQRQRLVSELMRPAATTHLWRSLAEQTPRLDKAATAGLSLVNCPTQREEALSIALMMRQALDEAEHTVALVTPDRDLGRRVAAELGRWGVSVDDSAGRPLAVTPPGAFLRLSAAMVSEQFAPVAVLAVLKHPLAGAGMDPALFRDAVRRLDIYVLRGVRPAPGIAGLRAALAAAENQRLAHPERYGRDDLNGLAALLDAVESCCAPLVDLMGHDEEPPYPFEMLLEGHLRMAEDLSATDTIPGPFRLWAEDAGDVAASWARDLADAAAALGTIPPRRYAALIDVLMGGVGVRQEFGSHPRLAILGPMEARLRHADTVIIGGLNEDVWPPRVAVDPWMSRPMRHQAGLPLPEQRIGHAAHDLAGLLCAPQVILTRAAKVDGTPAVPSRWLLRLETVLKAVGLPDLFSQQPWVRWAEDLDQPAAVTPISRPEPRPPVAARPRKLSVTKVETWMRDPYAIYAQSILGLSALDPLDDDPGASDYGTLVHGALELFQKDYPDHLPADPVEALLECGRTIFEQHIARPAVWAFWWPRFESLAKWVIEQEIERRPRVHKTYVEIKGTLELENFTLRAEADRIDLLHDGSLAIIDYKTGQPPSQKEVAAGFSPQLPLEALMAKEGAFPGVPKGRAVSELVFWHVKGGDEGGVVSPALGKKEKNLTIDDLAAQALEGLKGLIMAFDRQETPYLARPHPEHLPRYSDYLHLARVREWSAGEGDSE
jgi:ATP-dependent helicase/nuclease subunit B